jgi:HD domain
MPRGHRRVGDVTIPDSAAAREAERLAREESSPMLYGHAARSYLYAALLGDRDGMRYDAELLYVACLLHDLGLTPRFDDPVRPFEHVSADASAELVERHGWYLSRRYLLHRAIVLHMAPAISSAEEHEVLLLDAGISCDVSGTRNENVGRRAIEEVLRVYPRAGFKQRFTELMHREAGRKPRCHAAMHLAAGLDQRIRDAPYPG